MSVIAQIGARTGSKLSETTAFNNTSVSIVTIPGQYNESWMRLGTSSRHLDWDEIVPAANQPDNTPREYEFSFVTRCIGTLSTTLGSYIGLIRTSANFGLGMNVSMGTDAAAGHALVFNVAPDHTVATPDIVTGYLVTTDVNYAITVRIRSESRVGGVTQGDGAVEIWLNGDILIHSVYNLVFNTSANRADFSGRNQIDLRGGSTGDPHVRDVVVRDNWSTADGVAPGIPYIIDREVVAMSQLGASVWTDFDGNPEDVADLNDDTSTTGIKTTVVGDQMVMEMTPVPANTVGRPQGETICSYRAGRDPLSPTDVTVTPAEAITGIPHLAPPVSSAINASNPAKTEVGIDFGVIAASPLFLKVKNGV